MPPVFITEWNYDSAATGNPDPRIAQLVSMGFVHQALMTLKSMGIYAAYQYVLNTNAGYNLTDSSGNLTGYGKDFQSTCAGL